MEGGAGLGPDPAVQRLPLGSPGSVSRELPRPLGTILTRRPAGGEGTGGQKEIALFCIDLEFRREVSLTSKILEGQRRVLSISPHVHGPQKHVRGSAAGMAGLTVCNSNLQLPVTPRVMFKNTAAQGKAASFVL